MILRFDPGRIGAKIDLSKISEWIVCRSEMQVLLALYLFALVVRLLVALLYGISRPFVSDEGEYFEPALRMLQGQGFSRLWPDGIVRLSAYRVPGTSAFIALGLLFGGNHVEVARIGSVLFGSLAAPLMYLFARKVAPRWESLAAGLGCALYPTWVFLSGSVLSETYFIPLLLLSLALTGRALYSPQSSLSFGAGVAWAVTALVRPHGAPMALLIVLYLCFRSEWRRAFVFLAGFTVLIAPWLIRNVQHFGSPLLATESGETFLGSNNPYVVGDPALHGMWESPMAIPEYRKAIESDYDEVDRNRVQNKLAWRYLKENPQVAPRLAIYKLERWLTPITKSGGAVRVLVVASYGVLLVFLVIGCFHKDYHRSVELHLVVIWSLLMALLTAVYWGNLIRGRLSLELVWFPWCSIAAFSFFRWMWRMIAPHSIRLDYHTA